MLHQAIRHHSDGQGNVVHAGWEAGHGERGGGGGVLSMPDTGLLYG